MDSEILHSTMEVLEAQHDEPQIPKRVQRQQKQQPKGTLLIGQGQSSSHLWGQLLLRKDTEWKS